MSAKNFAPGKLVTAIRAGRLSGVIAALDDGADIEEADIHGFSGLPLRTACFAGEMAIIHELLRAGADVNALAADGPGAPIRLALRAGHPDIAALLVRQGAELPPGIDIDVDIMNRVNSLPPVAGEAPVPLLPENPATVDSENNDPFPGQLIEEVDVNACYGTDTNLLIIDLLHDESAEANGGGPLLQPDRTVTPKAGFWKTERAKE